MKLWQQRTLGILTLGGSFLGVVLCAAQLFGSDTPLLGMFLSLVFIALYAWGVWCGVELLEGSSHAVRINRIFWAVQIPYFMSPVAGYLFASGAFLYLTFQPFHLHFGFSFLFGSRFEISLLQSDKLFEIGANVFALAIYLFLSYCLRQTKSVSDSVDVSAAL